MSRAIKKNMNEKTSIYRGANGDPAADAIWVTSSFDVGFSPEGTAQQRGIRLLEEGQTSIRLMGHFLRQHKDSFFPDGKFNFARYALANKK